MKKDNIMTKFSNSIEVSSVEADTQFTHYVSTETEMIHKANAKPENFNFVDYLGTDNIGNDIFRAYDSLDEIFIYIGKKGSEFDC